VKTTGMGTQAPAEPARVGPPYGLLWLTGLFAVVLSVIAFVLWGVNGPSTILDMLVALCS